MIYRCLCCDRILTYHNTSIRPEKIICCKITYTRYTYFSTSDNGPFIEIVAKKNIGDYIIRYDFTFDEQIIKGKNLNIEISIDDKNLFKMDLDKIESLFVLA